jgi:hypothetical protein
MFEDITYYPYDPTTGKSTKPKTKYGYFTEQQLSTILIVACAVLVTSLLIGLFALSTLNIEQENSSKNKVQQESNTTIKH